MIFDEGNTTDILNIQTVAKNLGTLPKSAIGAGLGALLGSPFGPIGLVIGGLSGALLGAETEDQIPKVQCPHPHCGISFNYYSPHYTEFSCPACRRNIKLYPGED
jgi:hypothetical protein